MNPRLGLLRPYPFERLRTLLAGAQPPAALRHIPLSIGEPRHAPPAFVGEALTRALDTLGSYPMALGLAELRETIARWLERRFALPAGAASADTMVLPLNGTREGLFAFVQAVVDAARPAPAVLMPNPF
jgi:N-succinyldiaminopimelate aminotransferase